MPKAADILSELKMDVCEAEGQLVMADSGVDQVASLNLVRDTLERVIARAKQAERLIENQLFESPKSSDQAYA